MPVTRAKMLQTWVSHPVSVQAAVEHSLVALLVALEPQARAIVAVSVPAHSLLPAAEAVAPVVLAKMGRRAQAQAVCRSLQASREVQ